MNGSIHGERTASGQQDRSSSVAHSIEVPSEIIRKWQEFVNLLAEIMHVPSASIMRVDPPQIKVFVSSASKGNPCRPGAPDTGPYCATVMRTGQPLLVPDALENDAWKVNPHVRLGIISYLGVPISWPDGRIFGTICVRDNKRNDYSEAYLKLLLHFRDVLQADLKSFARLQGEIEEREAKIRQLVDANIIGIFVWDVEGRILEANDAFLRLIGYDREDVVAGRLRWTELTPPEWLDRDERRWLAELKVTGSLQPFEKEYFRKDGSRVPVLIGTATFEEDGNQGVSFVLDLTERKCAEERLRRSESYLAEAQRLSHTGTWVLDARAMRYLHWSDEAYRIWGFDPLQGPPSRENMWQRIHPDDRDRVWGEVQEALRQKRDFSSEFRILLPDGTIKYLEAATYHVFSSSGALAEAVSTQIDVTERKRAQDEHERLVQLESDLAHMNRLSRMGELVASLIHEITQPIGSARNNARAALNFFDRQTPDLGEVKEALGCVVGDADRAGQIVDRIRDHIKKAPLRKERVDLNEAINEVIVLARSAIIKYRVSIQSRLAEGLVPVLVDRVQLQQVILNLILNAVEAMGSVESGARELLISA